MDKPSYQVLKMDMARPLRIDGWPSSDLDGLFQALDQWTLDPRLDTSADDPDHPHAQFQAPFRGLAWVACRCEPIEGSGGLRRRYVGTKPLFEGHPQALYYVGNFLGYSFGFQLVTDDQALIEELDRRIARNMESQAYGEAKQAIEDRARRRWR